MSPGHTNILQHLRVDFQGLSQLAHGHLLRQHNLHHFQAGQDTITSASVLAEDDMPTLFTADTAAVPGHILVDILVTHGSLGVVDALLVKGLVQAKATSQHISVKPSISSSLFIRPKL